MGKYDTSDPVTGELLDEHGVPLEDLDDGSEAGWYGDGEVSLADWALFLGTGGASSYFGGDIPSFGAWSIADDDGDGEPNVTDPDALPDLPNPANLPGADSFGKAVGTYVGMGLLGLLGLKFLKVI